ncbi:MAG TPA: flagellar biosynthetic protein FliR [Candidatus Baltobacteraceae bacterium]|nr:flagellar biosynthetic protein FliR [Candidatus Baltobacteraceae bacterium]
MHLFGLTTEQFEVFLLIFLRVSSMLFLFPVISSAQFPSQLRLGLGALISFIIYRTVPHPHLAGGAFELLVGASAQVLLGVIVGFIASLVFTGIQFAGELIDLQIGFAIANVINPTTQQNITIIGEFQLALATLIFLATDSHYFLIQGIAGSFNLVPLPYINLDPAVAGNLTLFFSQAFLIVFRISAPVVVALFLTNVMLAFMARVAPQMNVFVIGLPIQVAVGLTMMAISIPLLAVVGPEIFQDVAGQMDAAMRGLRPP